MDINERIRRVLQCVLANGGTSGGVATVDQALTRALEDPGALARSDRIALLETNLGYFYSNAFQTFGALRSDLWRCLKEALGTEIGQTDEAPDTFNVTTRLLDLAA